MNELILIINVTKCYTGCKIALLVSCDFLKHVLSVYLSDRNLLILFHNSRPKLVLSKMYFPSGSEGLTSCRTMKDNMV